MKKVLIVVADGFCDDEAFLSQKLLNESGIETSLCALDGGEVVSSSGIKLSSLPSFFDLELSHFSALIIAGGLKCVKHYKENWGFVEKLITKPESLFLCAIGAVPAIIFAPLGLLEGKEATCLPLVSPFGMGYPFKAEDVCISGDIISAKDKSCIEPFVSAIVKTLS